MPASLPMYERPEVQDAHDRYWALIRDALALRGVTAPARLQRGGDDAAIWRDPGLVLSQTCGLPYRAALHGRVHLVGTPDYGLPDCAPGTYRSALVVHRDSTAIRCADLPAPRFAYNSVMSQSGWAAAQTHLPPDGRAFAQTLETGSHIASARAVAQGAADIAALDAQTWRMIRRYEPWSDRLRMLEWTAPTPGLPYITGPEQDADAVFDAVQTAIAALTTADRQTLDLRGIVRIPAASYLAVGTPASDAAAQAALRNSAI
ncbi:phosphate/phosphite/phosphonate ABC transporter substrate-binding protein [Sulfitobacter sp. S190]|uniref:phosphate/phosphite/phosphonate ABC transporter substrate-binding protein n=1 Tax=Sulfitobacter sp. S190 TaxID=2867022 RepID=UPI0021A682D6|nr:phosphate/phosphite/phosphonate ABC transporter substrate-binding protein [Sulfitobacter sp. S190]UWR22201.1 phosphate/phosphite/phosphonate ABC transporter substrate-binding protein [Sulfitobacter sp. S190]